MARDSDGIFTEKWADGGDTGEPLGFDRNEGWPISYSQPGGNHPTRLLFNLLFLELSALAIELNQNGAGLEYNATIDYIAKAIVRGSDGDYYIAASVNGPTTAVKNPVGDTTGVWENFYFNTSSNVVTGTANAIVLNAISGLNPSALFDGQLFTFKAASDNTGAMTLKVGALTTKSLTHGDGSSMQTGEIGQDDYAQAAYNKSLDRFEKVSIGRDIPTGEKILFYKNTAVLGYSLLDTLDDKVVYVTKGSAAGGQTGGAVHSSGSWTISGISVDNHTLTTAQMPAHTHTTPAYNDTPTGAVGFLRRSTNYAQAQIPTSSVGSGSSHPHGITIGSTWRPAAYGFTMQQRN